MRKFILSVLALTVAMIPALATARQEPEPTPPKVGFTLLVDNKLRLSPVARYEAATIEGFHLFGSQDVKVWGLTGIQTAVEADAEPRFTLGGALVLPWKLGKNGTFYAGVRGQMLQDGRSQLGLILGIEIR